MMAVCHRYLKDYNLALDAIARLKTLIPDHGRAHQEEGHIFRDMGRLNQAIRAYSLACRYNPALVASWKSQIDLLNRQGLQRQANLAQLQLEKIGNLPKPLLAATDLIAQGKLIKAEKLCRQFLQKAPHHIDAMRLLANIGMLPSLNLKMFR